MKKILLSLAICGFIFSASASVTVEFSDMQYVPKENREQNKVKDIKFDGELVAFANQKIVKTKGLIEALTFVDEQTQLSDLRRDALKALLYSGAFTLQNAHNSVLLQNHASTASQAAVCGYLGVNQELIFIIEGMFTKLVDGNIDYKNNLVYGSMNQVDVMPYSRDSQYISDSVMKCSENIKLWLQK